MASDLAQRPTAPAPAPRRRRSALLLAAAVGVVLVGLVVVLATRAPATTRLAQSPLLGLPAPEVAGRTIDGASFRLSDLRGQWVLVNFFATWCVPCRIEHPDLIRFSQRHAITGDAAAVGVVYDDSAAAVRRFRAKEGGDWPMVEDPSGRISVAFGVAGIPESFLVSPDGVVVAKVVGGIRSQSLERLLTEAKTRSAK